MVGRLNCKAELKYSNARRALRAFNFNARVLDYIPFLPVWNKLWQGKALMAAKAAILTASQSAKIRW
jgi:hypothetical protein